MQRLFASALLALLVCAPLIQARCAAACALEVASAGPCHEHEQTGPLTFTSGHGCGQHATPSVGPVGSRIHALDLAAAPPAAFFMPTPPPATIAASSMRTPPGGPPGSFVVPLRT
jgi:hypothetical protein